MMEKGTKFTSKCHLKLRKASAGPFQIYVDICIGHAVKISEDHKKPLFILAIEIKILLGFKPHISLI